MLALFLTRFASKYYTSKISRFLCKNMSSVSKRDGYIYVAFPDKALYLKQVDLSEIETESSLVETSTFFNACGSCYVVFAEDDIDREAQDHYIKSAINSQTIYRKSAEWKGVGAAHSVWGRRLGDSNGLYTRGVCLYATQTSEAHTSLAGNILNIAKQEETLVPYELKKCGKPNLMTLKCLMESKETDRELVFSVVSQSTKGQNLSPIFQLSELSPVYHSYREARAVLDKLSDVPEVKDLIKISDKHVSQDIQSQHYSLPHPFVVVEGMDATGKTTLTEELEKRMCAARYYTPPSQITGLRAFFDKYPEIVRRAYYSMGNYIVAMEIIRECQTRPVIMDRFWHSTTAYGIANMTSSGDFPEAGSSVYHWPTDLIKPTLVLFLTVSEEVRKQRLSGRGTQATFEERSLDRDWLFRQRLCESYRRMSNPSCVEIDAGGTIEEVKNQALNILNKHGVNF